VPINTLGAHTVSADGTLERLWECTVSTKLSATAIVPDRDLLYIDDYQNGTDSLVVFKAFHWRRVTVPLDANLRTIGIILLGVNEDGYILSSEAGGNKALISRIFLR
jgi:hypothetical protein